MHLLELEQAQQELARREPTAYAERAGAPEPACPGQGSPASWHAPTLTVRDRKQLLRTLLEEIARETLLNIAMVFMTRRFSTAC